MAVLYPGWMKELAPHPMKITMNTNNKCFPIIVSNSNDIDFLLQIATTK